MELERLTPELQKLATAAFPNYRGRKFRLKATERLSVASCWDGGSRDYFTFIRLADGATLPMPAQSAFDRKIQGADDAPVPPGFVVVEHSIFCGKDLGLTFHVNPADLAPMLPAGNPSGELTWAQRVVLYATRSLKSSYAGLTRADMARREIGITAAEYEAAKADLIASGLLNKAGAITPAGRNAIESTYSWPKRTA